MSKNQRSETRTATSLEAIVFVNGEPYACRVKNISAKGAQISSEPPTEAGDRVSLRIEPFGSILGEVAWRSRKAAGIKFLDGYETVEEVLLGLATYAMV